MNTNEQSPKPDPKDEGQQTGNESKVETPKTEQPPPADKPTPEEKKPALPKKEKPQQAEPDPWVDIDLNAPSQTMPPRVGGKKKATPTPNKRRVISRWEIYALSLGIAVVMGIVIVIGMVVLKPAPDPVQQQQPQPQPKQVVTGDQPGTTTETPTAPQENKETNSPKAAEPNDSDVTRSMRAKIIGNDLPIFEGVVQFGPGVRFDKAEEDGTGVTITATMRERGGIRVSGLTGSVEIHPRRGDTKKRRFDKSEETFRLERGGTIVLHIRN